MQRFLHLLLFALILGWTGEGFAQQPTVEERLIRLEEGQKSLEKRVEDLRSDMNQRFGELRADINQRFEAVDQRFGELRADMNQRFADMIFWLQLVFGAVFATLGAVVVQWLTTIRRVAQVETQVADHLRETEKDRLLMLQQERLEALTARLERLETEGR
jgi:chaperonin cofactor prefoldin